MHDVESEHAKAIDPIRSSIPDPLAHAELVGQFWILALGLTLVVAVRLTSHAFNMWAHGPAGKLTG